MRSLTNAIALLASGVALAQTGAGPAAAQDRATGPQSVVKCNFSRAARGGAAGPTLSPLVRGAFTPIPLESVQFVDKDLRRKVVVQSLMAQKTETDTVEIVTRLLNCTDKPLQIQARASFLSGVMAPTEPTSGWQRLFLQPRALGVYSEKSMSRDPMHYIVEVRIAD